ncbi:hypothetical protein Tco_0345610 [Tanacetum coccineum]
MASLDRRLNPLYAIKECSSCGNLHTKDCGCPKGSLEDKILVPVPDLSQRPLKIEKICLDMETPDYVYIVRHVPLIQRIGEVFKTSRHFPSHPMTVQTLLIQSHSLSKQGRQSCGKGAHIGYNCPPQIPIISKPEPCNNQTVNEFPQTLPSVQPTSCTGDENSFTYDSKPNFVDDFPNVFNPPL